MIIYVDASVIQTGNGTKENPFKTIQEAAAKALPGEEEWELLWLPPPCPRKELARPLPAIKSSAIIFPPVFPTLTPRLAIKLSIF